MKKTPSRSKNDHLVTYSKCDEILQTCTKKSFYPYEGSLIELGKLLEPYILRDTKFAKQEVTEDIIQYMYGPNIVQVTVQIADQLIGIPVIGLFGPYDGLFLFGPTASFISQFTIEVEQTMLGPEYYLQVGNEKIPLEFDEDGYLKRIPLEFELNEPSNVFIFIKELGTSPSSVYSKKRLSPISVSSNASSKTLIRKTTRESPISISSSSSVSQTKRQGTKRKRFSPTATTISSTTNYSAKKQRVSSKATTVSSTRDSPMGDSCKNMSHLKKYSTRPSPPYSANDCCGQTKKGNDGKMYISVPNIKGICYWRKVAK